MALSPRTVSIVIALFLSGSFIALGYYFSSPLAPRFADASSTDELLKAYAAKDTDADGLPDWQESLYGTDPENPHTTGPGVTDAEAVKNGTVKPKFSSAAIPEPVPVDEQDFAGVPEPASGTLTDQFSQAFMEQYFAAGPAMDDAGQQALVTSLLATFSSEAQKLVQSTYTASAVKTSSSATATEYASQLETVFGSYDISDDFGTVASLSQDLIEDGDASARQKLRKLGAALDGATKDLAGLSVPPTYAADHLVLIRSFDTLSRIAALMTSYEDDPVAALGGVSAYAPVSNAVLDVWRHLSVGILAEGEPVPGSFAAQIVDFARTAPKP